MNDRHYFHYFEEIVLCPIPTSLNVFFFMCVCLDSSVSMSVYTHKRDDE